MEKKNINKTNSPENAMNASEKVISNDKKLKQDFPGYPHHPANEGTIKGKNGQTNNNTTATGSESVRSKRPATEQNKATIESENELKSGNDRGLNMHEQGNNDLTDTDNNKN